MEKNIVESRFSAISDRGGLHFVSDEFFNYVLSIDLVLQ